ncbi:MAG: LD-carboxypeptidase [Bacteroidetes bacterium]|nr:MAG: LD-carboxypeptidase [Bacteroidota bacterium]
MTNALSRRNFLTGVSATTLAAIYPPEFLSFLSTQSKQTGPLPLIRPKALKPGDTVGLVAPATAVEDPETIALATDIAASLGFNVVVGRNAGKRYGYLGGSDKERAEDINEMFRRRDIDGVLPIQGGWGSMRVLPHIDFDLVRKNPKVFVGFSDITTLLLAFYKFAGLVTVHGPNVLYSFNPYVRDYYTRTLMSVEPLGQLRQPPLPAGETVERENRLVTIAGGTARGPLVGGNLSLLVTTLGTPFEVDLRGKLLFIEDVGEEPYRIDRMLTHLHLSGVLNDVAGVILGRFRDCEPKGGGAVGSLTLYELFRTRFAPLGKPCLAGLSFGHIRDHIPLPVGVTAELNADAKTVTLLESAVS